MVLVKSPFLGTKASGKLGDSLQFASHRGRHVAGRRRRPRQPRTEAQLATRKFMAWLSRQWSTLSPEQKATWLNYAPTPLLSPYHAYQQHNIDRIKHLPGSTSNPHTFPNWPTQTYPATSTGGLASYTGETATPGPGYVDFKRNITSTQDNWGFAYWRISTQHPKPVFASLVHIETVETTGWLTTRIEPLPPGLTKIRLIRFSHDGNTTSWFSSFTVTIPE